MSDIHRLSLEDEVQLQDLCKRCDDFSLLIRGEKQKDDAAIQILTGLPPEKQMTDKFVFGYFRKAQMIAVIDLIRDYKHTDEWYIGLLMLDPVYRGKGIGTFLSNWINHYIREQGGKTVRLGVFRTNVQGFRFWRKLGYIECDTSQKGNVIELLLDLDL